MNGEDKNVYYSIKKNECVRFNFDINLNEAEESYSVMAITFVESENDTPPFCFGKFTIKRK